MKMGCGGPEFFMGCSRWFKKATLMMMSSIAKSPATSSST
jgi:hypothetical protein